MIAITHLSAAAYNSERVASRRLAAKTGISEEQALRQTLELAAGIDGLPALLERRHAMREADAARVARRRAGQAEALARKRARHTDLASPWQAWFDGSAHPNPGRCGIGAVLRGPDGQALEISQAAGHGNSSEAEYRALIAVLQAALGMGADGLTIYGDSQVVVNDVNGSEDDAAPILEQYRVMARALLTQLPKASLRWIPRHKNGEADALSQRAVRLEP
jgi:ribonuclease HI